MSTAEEAWPDLPLEPWRDTYATLHMWTQIVGKIRLELMPWMNHSWHIPLYVTTRGLTTTPMPTGGRALQIDFDFRDHRLLIATSDGAERSLALEPRSVADFYAEVMGTLDRMRLPVRIWSTPVEIPSPIPFERDTVHHSYDPELANRFWRIVVEVHRVFTEFRSAYVGKSSPAHFFWGSFDLAVTRFSGRLAPPREGPAFMREAYSHEVISHGFWPGSGPILEPAFYAYAVPEPDGLKTAPVLPEAAYYHPELNEFVLPYEAVRKAASPDEAIAAFVQSTYDRAATLGGWDRRSLERG